MTAILKRSTKKQGKNGTKWTGVFLPADVHNYLLLFTYAKAISKTGLLTAAMEDWMADTVVQNPPEKLIQEIGDNALEAWMYNKARRPDTLLRAFRSRLIYELEWKGFTEEQIKAILIIFNNGTR